MTIKDIKAMFAPGQRWNIIRIDPIGIVGNVSNTVLPPSIVEEVRTVDKPRSNELVTIRPNNTAMYTPWPKASEIKEARPGYLHFIYSGGVPIELKMTLLP